MIEAYELLQQEEIQDIQAKGYLYKHKKSGARIMLLANDDENKVFNIAFRTPPANSTGVAHIIEHTLLCGSRKFPLKDPFVELVKGSLNTFLNAMTFPDKTMFPVASCNDTDFQNLMDVYLDAVFYPNIYKNEKIFQQEGWHYHLEQESDPLTYNGVVYNEMKGAFSSADEVLNREVFNTLFPDTAYGVESGGDPRVIPSLSYEEFLDFHRKYYHPSNSYIYLYGNMDMEEKLDWLDKEYLSSFDKIQVDSEIGLQKPFGERKDVRLSYPILDHEEEENNTYLSYNMAAGTTLDVKLCVAFSVLEYALLDAPGAPVKQALLDAHIGKDVVGSYEDGILQPYFQIVAKNANASDKEEFLKVIHDTLQNIVDQGIDKKAILAGINYFEFRFREADYASYPKGLIYGIDVFDSWLYDDGKPWMHLKQLEVFQELKQEAEKGYYEGLIQKYLLSNEHSSMVTLVPEKGLTERDEQETAKKLASYKATLSQEELESLVEQTRALKEFQESEDSEEIKKCIPLLKRSDIRKESIRLYHEEHRQGDTVLLHHNLFTNGIAYVSLLFDTKHVPDELISYMGILKSVLGYVSTERFSYSELFNEINADTGGISCGLQVFQNPARNDDCTRMFGVRLKCLYHKLDFAFDMVKEILNTSKLDDEKRLYEILGSLKARLQQAIPGAGHSSAVLRASSYFSAGSYFQEQIAGITFYELVENLEKNFEERKADLIDKLKTLMGYIFRPENLFVSVTADENGYKGMEQRIAFMKEYLHKDTLEQGGIQYRLEQKNEAFKTAGQVQYVATCGNFREAGFDYTGSLRILKMILNYDYLWMNLRVKGGAYGCMSGFKRTGEAYLVSYRDPNLSKTLETYKGIKDYLNQFDCPERDMTKYIIGTISELDTPLNPSAKGSVSLNAYFSGLTEADFQKERDEILGASCEDIRRLAELVDAVVSQHNICVIGSSAEIEKDKEVFKEIKQF
ncbi:MAG TPA: insulinase family protein [Candidatus Pelethocola excrementipullorum]|nr:insulinase family protein [Candidatus Pelethocola excrementipullorum]